MDKTRAEVHATLFDEGDHFCSTRTRYGILEGRHEVHERRTHIRHPRYVKPQLLATAPNQVWTWDITKLLGSAKFVYFYLNVMLDIFSRYVVGRMATEHENAAPAQRLIRETVAKYEIPAEQLPIHADSGARMTAITTAQLLACLGVKPSYWRPHVSNDNPFSEAQYMPDFPERFGRIEHVVEHFNSFFPWYNNEHHHSGIGFLTPADVHFNRAPRVIAQRQAVLDEAHACHPERFVRCRPLPPRLPEAVWINPSAKEDISTQPMHTNFQLSVSQYA